VSQGESKKFSSYFGCVFLITMFYAITVYFLSPSVKVLKGRKHEILAKIDRVKSTLMSETHIPQISFQGHTACCKVNLVVRGITTANFCLCWKLVCSNCRICHCRITQLFGFWESCRYPCRAN